MESLHFINIIFAELPDEQSIGPGEFNFFYISPLKSLNLGIIPRCKIRWPPGHLGCNLFAKFQRTPLVAASEISAFLRRVQNRKLFLKNKNLGLIISKVIWITKHFCSEDSLMFYSIQKQPSGVFYENRCS